jgi:hypothetical protein
MVQAPKTHQVNKKITTKNEREKEGKRTEGALGACMKKKHTHKQTKKGSLIFLGKSLGKPRKDSHALDSPEN